MVINNIRPSKAPNLPIAPVSYSQQYVDQLTNAFRLYFAQLDNFNQSVGGPIGGKYLQFPHIAASDSTDQYATANNTPTVIKWNTLESGDGFTLQAPGSATPLQTGVYKITYSLQFANTENAVHDAVVWLRINGTNVSNSSTSFSIPARKSAGVPSYVCGYSEVVFTIDADSVVELVWATDQAYSTTGPVNGVFIFADPAQTSPYARPAIPSALGSITFVSAITA
jgi:hypothetical protein